MSDLIQIVIALITASGIIMAIIANRNQLKTFNNQLKLNFFTDYTKRYQEIVLNLPEDITEDSFNLEILTEDLRSKTKKYMRAYFDLCSEEFHLNQNGHLDQSVWAAWQDGIKYALTKKAFKEAWPLIKVKTMYKIDFQSWVERQILSND